MSEVGSIGRCWLAVMGGAIADARVQGPTQIWINPYYFFLTFPLIPSYFLMFKMLGFQSLFISLKHLKL